MGVLQRIAICYFLVATLELVLYTKITLDSTKRGLKYYLYDLIWSKWHLLVMAAVTFLWFMLIYMVQIDGCPRGYMGPGGLEHHGKYFNCTGGVTGYFDILVLGESFCLIFYVQVFKSRVVVVVVELYQRFSICFLILF